MPKLLVMNDHHFFNVMGQSTAFSDITADVVQAVVPTQVVLAQEINGMLIYCIQCIMSGSDRCTYFRNKLLGSSMFYKKKFM